MPHLPLNGPERGWQARFSKLLFLLPIYLVLESSVADERPDRKPRAAARAEVSAAPLPVSLPRKGEIPIGGLWRLTSPEPRFGGLSALAEAGADFLAVTDSGTIIHWPRRGGVGSFRDLPDGPGPPQWKIHRDAEAMVRDPAGRGWWIAFEQFHSLVLFNQDFTRSLARRPVRLRTWWRNWGVEALANDGRGDLLLLPENGGRVIRLGRMGDVPVPLNAPGQIADAVRLQDGRILLALRRVRPWGIANSLGWLEPGKGEYRVKPWGELPLGRWDNVEGLAAEPLPNGGSRLWFVTDDDFDRRTVLGWVHVAEAPVKTGAAGVSRTNSGTPPGRGQAH